MERVFAVGDIYAMPKNQIIYCLPEGRIQTSRMYVVTCEGMTADAVQFRFTGNGEHFEVQRHDISPLADEPTERQTTMDSFPARIRAAYAAYLYAVNPPDPPLVYGLHGYQPKHEPTTLLQRIDAEQAFYDAVVRAVADRDAHRRHD